MARISSNGQANYSEPEPPPKANSNPSIHDLVIEDIKDRKEFGIKKYGTLLQAGNGRSIVDAYQESLDLVCYLRKQIEENELVIKALLLMVRQYLTLADSDGLLFHWHVATSEQILNLLLDLGYVQHSESETKCYEFTSKAIELMDQL